jgi:hypothetical protein
LRLSRAGFARTLGAALAAPSAFAQSCPAEKDGQRLSEAQLFDGDPAGGADQEPDLAQDGETSFYAMWDVRPLLEDNRAVTVLCQYQGKTDTITVKVDGKTKQCVLRKGGAVTMICK